MDPELVHAILDKVENCWTRSNDLEVTLEANPSSVEAGRFRAYAEAGISRVSIGVQALRDDDLKSLGRLHTVAEAQHAFEIAVKNFERVSFDLIYARQNQTLDRWRAELREALSMSVDHVSLYQLTVETGTAFAERRAAGGLKGLPNDDLAADMYAVTQECCAEFGLSAYEISNHARPGAESRHNLIYWRYGDYAGVGPGAHGRLTVAGQKFATESWPNPDRWLEAVRKGTGDMVHEPLSPVDQAVEYLMMGLRIPEGIDTDRYLSFSGTPLPHDKINDLSDIGLIQNKASRLVVTPSGRPLLNSIIKELLA